MKFQLSLLASIALIFTACGSKDDPPGTNPANAPTDYIGAIAKGKKKSEATVENMKVIPAIQQFQASESRYPKSLQELVDEGYLQALPQAPAGKKVDYNPETGEFKIVAAQ